jgi:hypothetical protein
MHCALSRSSYHSGPSILAFPILTATAAWHLRPPMPQPQSAHPPKMQIRSLFSVPSLILAVHSLPAGTLIRLPYLQLVSNQLFTAHSAVSKHLMMNSASTSVQLSTIAAQKRSDVRPAMSIAKGPKAGLTAVACVDRRGVQRRSLGRCSSVIPINRCTIDECLIRFAEWTGHAVRMCVVTVD